MGDGMNRWSLIGWRRAQRRSARRHWMDREAFAWVVLLLSLTLTLVFWRNAETTASRREHDNFLRVAEKHLDILATRMKDYEQVLRGGAALFATVGMPTREQWRVYVEALELDQWLPGILGTGVALMVPHAERAAHEQATRALGFPGYTIYPPGRRERYSTIIYLEPFSGRNLRAFGYDMFSDPVRREAMERARDTGLPALSRMVTLVQETGSHAQPGFLIFFPVYANMPVNTVQARRDSLIGFVYSPFRSYDLMEGIFRVPGQIIEIELYDTRAARQNLLYASERSARSARYIVDMPLNFGGHVWVARFRSSARLEATGQSGQPALVLFGGLVLDLLLFSILYMNARHRRTMREASEKLEQSFASYRNLVENIPGAVYRYALDPELHVEQLSHGIRALTSEPPERFLAGEIAYADLIHVDDRPSVTEAIAEAVAKRSAYEIEYRIRPSGRAMRWVNERGRVVVGADGRARWLDGLILDITERKTAEMTIRDLAFNDTLTGLPNRRLLLDRLEHQLAASARSRCHDALLFIDMDNFKTINDTLGHEAGDAVLVEVARRLQASVRETDTVARLGGDEFVVILDNLAETAEGATAEAAQLGSKILAALSQPYRFGKHVCKSTPSIGITIFSGHEVSAEQLLKRADEAMYQAKAGGRRQVRFYGEQPSAPTGRA